MSGVGGAAVASCKKKRKKVTPGQRLASFPSHFSLCKEQKQQQQQQQQEQEQQRREQGFRRPRSKLLNVQQSAPAATSNTSRTPLVQRRYRRHNNNTNNTNNGYEHRNGSTKERKKKQRAPQWSREWETIAYREDYKDKSVPCTVPLSHGGSLKVFVSLLIDHNNSDKEKHNSGEKQLRGMSRVNKIKAEMLTKVQYRQYKIQNINEPRIHALYNQDAASSLPSSVSSRLLEQQQDPLEDPTILSPGYVYAKSISMKSRPLAELPEIHHLANEMAALCRVESWNIGVEMICYRDGNDQIGMHADDDQGEEIIMTALIECPSHGRSVLVQSVPVVGDNRNQHIHIPPDEQFRLILQSTDAYVMDQAMQRVYKHHVPRDTTTLASYISEHSNNNNSSMQQQQRLAIVFRSGRNVLVKKDSGHLVSSLTPEPLTRPPYSFGPIPGIHYGGIYKRTELLQHKAHSGVQRSVSGNIKFGCDAIIVSTSSSTSTTASYAAGWNGSTKSRLASLEDDRFGYVLFAAEPNVGAKGLITSAQNHQPIRVFRKVAVAASNKENTWSTTTSKTTTSTTGRMKQNRYRYDGLYSILDFGTTELRGVEINLFVLKMCFWKGQLEGGNQDPSKLEYQEYVDQQQQGQPQKETKKVKGGQGGQSLTHLIVKRIHQLNVGCSSSGGGEEECYYELNVNNLTQDVPIMRRWTKYDTSHCQTLSPTE